MPLRVVVEYKISMLAGEAAERGRFLRIAKVSHPFDATAQKHLAVPADQFRAHAAEADRMMSGLARIAALPKEADRLAAFSQQFTGSIGGPSLFTSFLIMWALRNGPVTGEPDLLAALFARGVGLTQLPSGFRNLFLQKLILLDPARDYQQAVFDLQTTLDRDQRVSDLISAVAPPVALAVAGLFPTGSAVLVGFAIDGLLGLIDFFVFMADAEADGIITEAEAGEAWWQLLGVLPFSLVGLVLTARAVGTIGAVLFELLIAAVQALPELLERWRLALESDWNGFGEVDAASELFLPSYAVADLRAARG